MYQYYAEEFRSVTPAAMEELLQKILAKGWIADTRFTVYPKVQDDLPPEATREQVEDWYRRVELLDVDGNHRVMTVLMAIRKGLLDINDITKFR